MTPVPNDEAGLCITQGSSAPPIPEPLGILLLEDSDIDAELLDAVLADNGLDCKIDRVATRDAFAAALASRYDVILADYVLPAFDGLSAMAMARAQCPEVPFIFVSGVLGEEVAVEAMKEGAADYVVKQKLARLPRVIRRALAEAKAHRDQRAAERELQALNQTLETRVEERTHELAEANAELRRQIIERERVERALHQSQRLEAVGQLTSGVAHDFNNLLTVISGNLEFLVRGTTDPKVQRRLGMMRHAADRGARLTAQLLAFSRRQKLKPTPVQLNQTVASMSDLLQSSIGGAVKIDLTLQADLWPALVDATQIELAILNLAINARDAMTVGGRLTIETANVQLAGTGDHPDEPPPGDYIMVAVSDTGTGIEPQVLERIFEPFFTTKAVGKGSGLGLAQVYGFAKQSGGSVRIDTRVGEGTSVKVYLPRVAEQRLVSPPAPLDDDRRPGESRQADHRPVLLVVDDDDAVRDVTVTMLTEAGFAVRQASCGSTALSSLERGARVDLVVLDFAMPGMNGADVALEIRKRWPSLPIVFVTGYAETSALTKIDAISADNIVQKPFRGSELEGKVFGTLARSQAPRLELVSVRSEAA